MMGNVDWSHKINIPCNKLQCFRLFPLRLPKGQQRCESSHACNKIYQKKLCVTNVHSVHTEMMHVGADSAQDLFSKIKRLFQLVLFQNWVDGAIGSTSSEGTTVYA